ncbi:coiled-coil domain-containing protein 86-like isoform X2 [Poeciliopsis prolifica]|uniref:coiled-coil domain-containing protein 86-like isoform X2 n=1 Tax=Poeciliopsis prolifica TaxID=188132 RepID=UPI0024142C16|nr:coiled-coil domain-containing protein 86-like isoform X2 [Poeciliopsis prolifica]
MTEKLMADFTFLNKDPKDLSIHIKKIEEDVQQPGRDRKSKMSPVVLVVLIGLIVLLAAAACGLVVFYTKYNETLQRLNEEIKMCKENISAPYATTGTTEPKQPTSLPPLTSPPPSTSPPSTCPPLTSPPSTCPPPLTCPPSTCPPSSCPPPLTCPPSTCPPSTTPKPSTYPPTTRRNEANSLSA